ncbi:MAG: NACHT domain-containing protein [Cyanobacteria bacterium P01_A01_bin.123]
MAAVGYLDVMMWPLLTTLLAQADLDTPTPEPTKLEQILNFLNQNPVIGWGMAGFAVIALATAAIAAWTGNLGKIIEFIRKYLVPTKAEITDEVRQKLRRQLIEVVLEQVVIRLDSSLHYKVRMDLKREEQRQRVGKRDLPPEPAELTPEPLIKRWLNTFNTSTPSESAKVEQLTLGLFEQDDIQGRLLILGEPGSGKTNELLVLARELLHKAQQDPDLPIPVIFELSEWADESTFDDWLSAQLLEKYTVPKVVSQHWIQQNQLLPLLDGLDELRRVDGGDASTTKEIKARRKAKQIKCIRAINAFLDIHALSMVVCCRRKEYEALEAENESLKRLNGAIYLQALDDEQIQDYLQRLNRVPLWNALQSQPDLLELVRSPLFLLILVVAYQGQTISSVEALLDTYINKQLSDLNNQGAYPPGQAPSLEQTQHYLSWLAGKLEAVGTTEFLIERLQPSWLDRQRDWTRYLWSVGLTSGLSGGLIGGLAGALSDGLIFGLIGGLISGLIFGLSGGLNNIKSAEALRFSWQQFARDGLSGGLIVGLIFGLITGLGIGLSNGLLFGLSVGLSIGLSVGLIGGFQGIEVDLDSKKYPNQGIQQSKKNGLIFGLIFGLSGGLTVGLSVGLSSGLIGGLTGGLNFGLSFGLSFGLIGGLIGGLIVGLGAALQHLSLRLALYQSGVSPWDYAKFLEHAENHRFIQRVGGRYRFMHDLLRKHFASLETPSVV